MESEQLTTWPPTPKEALTLTEVPKPQFLTGKKSNDSAVAAGTALMLYVLVQFGDLQLAEWIATTLLTGRFAFGPLPDVLFRLLSWLPSLIGLILAVVVYVLTRRPLPVFSRTFGLVTIAMIMFNLFMRWFIAS